MGQTLISTLPSFPRSSLSKGQSVITWPKVWDQYVDPASKTLLEEDGAKTHFNFGHLFKIFSRQGIECYHLAKALGSVC